MSFFKTRIKSTKQHEKANITHRNEKAKITNQLWFKNLDYEYNVKAPETHYEQDVSVKGAI